jgi:diamine N-acetyltransferase
MTVIKRAGTAAIPLIRNLANETWAVAYKDILSPEQMQYMLQLIYSAASLEEQMVQKQHQLILAYDGTEAVGFASYSPKSMEEPLIYRLHKIYIHPNQQGKGTGKVLLDYILADIKAQSATGLELNVNRHNKAKHFYQKMGFEIIKEEDIDIGNGYWMNDYVMMKLMG